MRHLLSPIQEHAKAADLRVYELKHHERLSKLVAFCPIGTFWLVELISIL